VAGEVPFAPSATRRPLWRRYARHAALLRRFRRRLADLTEDAVVGRRFCHSAADVRGESNW